MNEWEIVFIDLFKTFQHQCEGAEGHGENVVGFLLNNSKRWFVLDRSFAYGTSETSEWELQMIICAIGQRIPVDEKGVSLVENGCRWNSEMAFIVLDSSDGACRSGKTVRADGSMLRGCRFFVFLVEYEVDGILSRKMSARSPHESGMNTCETEIRKRNSNSARNRNETGTAFEIKREFEAEMSVDSLRERSTEERFQPLINVGTFFRYKTPCFVQSASDVSHDPRVLDRRASNQLISGRTRSWFS